MSGAWQPRQPLITAHDTSVQPQHARLPTPDGALDLSQVFRDFLKHGSDSGSGSAVWLPV